MEDASIVYLPVLNKVSDLKAKTSDLLTAAIKTMRPELAHLLPIGEALIESLNIIFDPPTSSQEVVHCICATGLNKKELAQKVASIEDENLRKRLAQKVKPYITDKMDSDTMKLFQLTSFDEEEERHDSVDGDTMLQTSSSRFVREVYYSKCILIRKGGVHSFICAYYSTVVELPYYSLRALLQCDDDSKREAEYYVAMGMHTLHQKIAIECPRLVKLNIVHDHKLLISS